MHTPFLVGTKIYLRPLERGDAPRFVTWLNDAQVTQYLLRHNPLTLAAQEERLNRVTKSEEVELAIVRKQADQLIGVTGLNRFDWRCRHAAFEIIIGEKNYWGQGHGTEATRLIIQHAFQTLNLNRIWLHVGENNLRALHVYEKLGFRREGVLRQHTFRDGRYWDILTMGLLRVDAQDASSQPGNP